MNTPKERRKKASYSCAPCKRLKIKCDHAIPCSNCIKNNRTEECLNNPAKSLTQFKELIKPNPLFGRITKPIIRKDSPINIQRPQPFQSQFTDIERNDIIKKDILIEDFKDQIAQKTIALDQLIKQNSSLTSTNEELIRRISYFIHMNKKSQPIQELFTVPPNEQDNFQRIDLFKRSMLDILPTQDVIAILTTQFLVYFNENCLINPSYFDSQLQKFWYKFLNNNIIEIDLHWLALLFMILSVSLTSSLNTSVLSSSPFFQHVKQLEKNGIELSLLWFNTARQIITFIRDENDPKLVNIQILLVGSVYCRLVNNLKLFDYFISDSIHELNSMNLIENFDLRNKSDENNLKSIIFWKLANTDTIRSLNSKRIPILTYNSKIPLPSESFQKDQQFRDSDIPSTILFDICKSKLTKHLNKLKIDSLTDNEFEASEFQEILRFDKNYTNEFLGFPEVSKLEKNTALNASPMSLFWLFDIHNLHLFYSITRFKIFQKFLGHSIPYIDTVCLSIVKNIFFPYKVIRKTASLDGDPTFLHEYSKSFDQSIIGGCIIQLLFLIFAKNVNDQHKTLILKDVDMILTDLTFLQQRVLIQTKKCVINEGFRLIKNLKCFIESNMNKKLNSSKKMNLSLLVNNSGVEFSPQSDRLNDVDIIPDQKAIEVSIEKYLGLTSSHDSTVFNRIQDGMIEQLIQTEGFDFRRMDIEDFNLNSYI